MIRFLTTLFLSCFSLGVFAQCATTTVMSCGTNYTATLAPNSGSWTNYTGVTWNYNGSEKVWSFTPATTGSYTFNLNEGTNDADFILMNACSNTATNLSSGYWTGTSNITITLTAGVTYYLIADLYASSSTTVSVSVTCPNASTAPANDLCANATALPCGTTNLAGTTVNTTNVSDPSGCASSYGVWYSFVGNGQSTTISSTATFDHEMSISSGSCGSLSNITCEDGSTGTESYTFTTTNGVTYFVYIAHYSTSSSTTGTFTISRTCAAAPTCTADMTINTTTYSNNGLTTCGFGDDYSSSDACGSSYMGGDDIVIEYTPTTTQCVSISLTNTDTWTGVFLLDNCPDISGASCLANNTNSSGNPSISNFNVVAGTTYYIVVSTFPSPQCTAFDLDITACPSAPANDECAGAISLTVNPDLACATTTSGTIENATASSDANSCYGSDDDDVWFSFVATATTHYVDLLNVAGSVTDMYHVLYEGPCGSLTELYCSDANSSTASSLTIGNTYFIRVYTYTSTGGQNSTFDVCITSDPPPVTACSGTYYDTGGSSGTYTNNEYYTQTYCSSVGGQCLSMTFSSFNTESGYDKLTIYNGADITAPVIGTYSGSSLPNGGVITANSGCLTIEFDSDGSNQNSGWAFTLSCVTCPTSTCNDGIQNGDETGVDCGGSVCGPCTTPADVCEDANPFCSDLVYNFPTTVDGGSAVVGPDYGCLGTQPNPVWYFLQIDANGDLEIEIASDCGDVDYAAWGPFPAVTCANSDLTTSGSFMYEYYGASTDWEVDAFSAPSGNMVDCSYDIDAVEYLYIPNGVIGDYYVVMISNYKNCDGLLTFSQISGTGSSNCSIVLPIELLKFNGYSENGYNLLEWITTTEINNDLFEIEKSTDGVLFNKIGEVDGGGNSSTNKTYQYIDNNPNSGISYYRLKQVDYNGEYSYSNVVAVKQSNGAEVSIFPNPTVGKVKLNFVSKEEGTYTINVYDISKEIYEEQLFIDKGNKVISFDLFEKLSKGFYIVKVTDENGNVIKTERVIKH